MLSWLGKEKKYIKKMMKRKNIEREKKSGKKMKSQPKVGSWENSSS
jgi:hypothetical protein